MDSGTAESVILHLLINEHPIRETEASLSGLNYMSATGDSIPNIGERRLPLITREGSERSMTLQVAPVGRPLGSVKRICPAGHRVVFDSDGSHFLNNATKGGQQKLHAGHVGHTYIMAATSDERRDEGFYEVSPANRNQRASPINADGLDAEGRREAGLVADDEDKCRVVRSRDLDVLGFTSNPCDSSGSSSTSTSSSDAASELSEPRNEVTEEDAMTMHQPMCASQATKRLPSGGPEFLGTHARCKGKTLGSAFALQIVVSAVRKSSWTKTHTELRKGGKPTWNCLRFPWTTLRLDMIKKKVKQESCLSAETGSRSLHFAIS